MHHLVLRGDVIQAVSDGSFHIYPVHSIDEGLAILACAPEGAEGVNVKQPIANCLRELAVGLKEFANPAKDAAIEIKP